MQERGDVVLEGLGLAVLGFALSRFVVAESLQVDAALPFLVVGLLPLVVGLGLSVVGIVLAIGGYGRAYVRSVTGWAFVGTVAILALIGLTALDALLRGDAPGVQLGSDLFVANVVLGGAVGGAIIGDRIAVTRASRRRIQHQADLAVMVNRLLRHDVLNAATVIQGYATLPGNQDSSGSPEAIESAAQRIEATIERVGDLAGAPDAQLGPISLDAAITNAADRVGIATPETGDGAIAVRADAGLEIALRELFEAMIARSENEVPDVSVDVNERVAEIRVRLEEVVFDTRDARMLTTETVPEYDDPTAGFGLQMVRLLVARYEGTIAVDRDQGTSVAISLPRARTADRRTAPAGVGRRDLLAVTGAALLAGAVMGIYLQYAIGAMPVIGALYAVPNAVVGWITHQFHSVVFGLLFVAGLETPWLRPYDRLHHVLAVGAGWGVVLWLLGAGLVMPLWLQLVGIDATVPNLALAGLASHALWGCTLGLVYGLLGRRRR